MFSEINLGVYSVYAYEKKKYLCKIYVFTRNNTIQYICKIHIFRQENTCKKVNTVSLINPGV